MTYTTAPDTEDVTCTANIDIPNGDSTDRTIPCGFEGEAEVTTTQHSANDVRVDWTCPRCHTRTTEYRSANDDLD